MKLKHILNIHRSQSNSRPSSQHGISNNHYPYDSSWSPSGFWTLLVQIHKTTPRVDWKEQTGTLKMEVSPFFNLVGPPSSKDLSRLAAPWQGWEPDSNFPSEFHKWNIAHKDDNLPMVLAKVNSILESNPLKAALNFISDNPFPAKSLIKAMISLFKRKRCLLSDPLPSTHHISST